MKNNTCILRSIITTPKIDLKMKLTFILLFTTLLNISASSYSQKTKISLNLDDVSVEKVFFEIMDKTDFKILYAVGEIDLERKVSVIVKKQRIEKVLDILFLQTGIKYSIVDKQIVLVRTTPPPVIGVKRVIEEKKLEIQNQISGVVVDESGIPLPGVNIIIEGTTVGTQTDFDGKYSIQANQGDILDFSYVGMKTQIIKVGASNTIDVVLLYADNSLDEVVVIGYGTQKKASITGSVATVKGDILEKTPTTNLTSALAGQMAGVIVNTRGSMPGSESININIRGKSSWRGGGPLIIIDGIANRSGFEKLNPNEIENISVLKDASAAIYGSRGANGVILVTTKRGKEGAPTIEYTGDFGLTQPTRVPEMTRSWQYATYYTEAQRNGYIWTDEEIEKFKQGSDPNLYPNYNLEDYMLQSVAPQTTHSLSVRGGSKAVKYFISSRYLYQDSFFKDGIDDFNSASVRSNIDATVHENFTLSLNLSGRRDDTVRAQGSDSFDNIDVGFFGDMLGTDPTKPLFYENGFPASIYSKNVTSLIKGDGGQTDSRTTTINTQVSAKWDLPFITEGLFLQGSYAYDFANIRSKSFSKSYDMYAFDNSTGEYSNLNTNPMLNRGLSDYFNNSYKYTLTARLGYQRTFNHHNISAFVAYEQYSMNTEWIQASRSSFLSDQIPYLFAGDPNTQKNNGSGTEFAYRNYFGRITYAYKEKYLLDFTLRRDESIKFPESGRIGWFPSVSLGWRLSEENFIKDNLEFVDNLKLRASYGQMGSDNVADYQYLATAALRGSFGSYVLGADPAIVPSLYFSNTPNPNISWEVANSFNVALDGALWQGLLGFEVEYFLVKRSNILAVRNASVPTYAGMTLPAENIGKAQNHGFELMLNHRQQLGDFSYGINANFTFTSNEIIYMDESPNIPDYQRQEGHPIDSWLLYKTDGIYNTQEEFDATPVKLAGARVGDIKYIDVNDDGTIDDNDKVRLYDSSLPKFYYGLNFDFGYKDFSLTMQWQGQADAKTYINPTNKNGDINIPLWMYNDRWTPENAENATMPRAFFHRSEPYNTLKSDFWLEDASFLRLKTLQLAYNLPKDIVSKASMSSARIYISGYNLLLFDSIKNYDPEVVNDLGVFYPATKVYNIGVNLTF